MEEKGEKQHTNNFDWLKEYAWQKGQSGNPAGRPKGKSLKEYSREFLANMSEEARIEFIKNLDPEVVWKMAEGNPHSTSDGTMEVTLPVPLDKYVRPDTSLSEDQKPEETP